MASFKRQPFLQSGKVGVFVGMDSKVEVATRVLWMCGNGQYSKELMVAR